MLDVPIVRTVGISVEMAVEITQLQNVDVTTVTVYRHVVNILVVAPAADSRAPHLSQDEGDFTCIVLTMWLMSCRGSCAGYAEVCGGEDSRVERLWDVGETSTPAITSADIVAGVNRMEEERVRYVSVCLSRCGARHEECSPCALSLAKWLV